MIKFYYNTGPNANLAFVPPTSATIKLIKTFQNIDLCLEYLSSSMEIYND